MLDVISKRLANIFQAGELDENSVISKMGITAANAIITKKNSTKYSCQYGC